MLANGIQSHYKRGMGLNTAGTNQEDTLRKPVVVSCDSPKVVGSGLRLTMGPVFAEIPDCSMRPTDIARLLDVSRVMVGRVLSSIGKEDPIETLMSIPGPETLRLIVRASKASGLPVQYVEPAHEAIDQFDRLIREQYGTRGAMNAALSADQEDGRERFEQSSRYQAFKGMSQILGVQSKVWLTCMMMTPSSESGGAVDVTTIHGTTGLRRLRSDTPPVHFIYGKPANTSGSRQSPERMELDLTPFFANTSAPLEVREADGQIINTFDPDVIGKDAVYDMFAGVRVPSGSNRYAAPGRKYRGTIVLPDVPVTMLVSDIILHKDLFKGITPELFVHNTMGKGGADIEDPTRAMDLIETSDSIEDLGVGIENIGVPDFPKYTQMIEYLCSLTRHSREDFRVHRLMIQYPVYGFQYAIGYRVPSTDASPAES